MTGAGESYEGQAQRIDLLRRQLNEEEAKVANLEAELELLNHQKNGDSIKIHVLQAERDKLRALLRKYQWSARRGKHGTQRCCPCCLNFEKDGDHSSDCDIGNALKGK